MMRFARPLCIALSACIFVPGCIRKPEKEDKTSAPGGERSDKAIVFKYDARAPKKWLKITKGTGEGAHVDVYVGKTRVGSLNFGTFVQNIGEEKGWYKVRYANNDGEFFGYIRYADAQPVEKTRGDTVIMVGEDAEPKMYTMQQTEEMLSDLLKVPYKLEVVETQPEVKREKVFGTDKNIDGYESLDFLKKLRDEPQAHVYVGKLYTELGSLYQRSPPSFREVIKLYAQALQYFREKNMRFFEDYLKNAEQKRAYIMRSYR